MPRGALPPCCGAGREASAPPPRPPSRGRRLACPRLGSASRGPAGSGAAGRGRCLPAPAMTGLGGFRLGKPRPCCRGVPGRGSGGFPDRKVVCERRQGLRLGGGEAGALPTRAAPRRQGRVPTAGRAAAVSSRERFLERE